VPTLRDGHDLIDELSGATGCPQPVTQALANARVPSTKPVAPTAHHRSLVGLLRSNTSLPPKRRHEPRTQWWFGQFPREPRRANPVAPNEPNGGLGNFQRVTPGEPSRAERTQWGFGQFSREPRRADPIAPSEPNAGPNEPNGGLGNFSASRAERTQSRRTNPMPGQTNPMGVWAISQRAEPSEPNRAERTQWGFGQFPSEPRRANPIAPSEPNAGPNVQVGPSEWSPHRMKVRAITQTSNRGLSESPNAGPNALGSRSRVSGRRARTSIRSALDRSGDGSGQCQSTPAAPDAPPRLS
jgi:hypothetical protein